MFKVPNDMRLKTGALASTDADGNNGVFKCCFEGRSYLVQASDGMDWEHVSVSIIGAKTPPRWNAMCYIKNLFWDAEDCVVQYHPPKKDYVNNHSGCLHLWRPVKFEIPRPPKIMVGI